MTTDRQVADFERLLQRAQQAGTDTNLFLQVMEPKAAHLFRLCAIPHQYDLDIMPVLLPGLSEDEARHLCQEFSRLSVVTPVGQSWAIHEKSRREIFARWLTDSGREEFRAVSRRLADFFGSRIENTDGEARETAMRRHMYHLIGADQTAGLQQFEHLCRRARAQLRYAECGALIRLFRDYDPVLTPEHRVILSYHEGKMESDMRDWQTAERLFTDLVQDPAADPVVRAKSQLRLGYVLAQERRFQEALDACRNAHALAQADERVEKIMPRILHELGIACRDVGEQTQAEEFLVASAERAALMEEWDTSGIAYNSLGRLYLQQKMAPKAIRSFEMALEKLESKDQLRASQVYNNLGLAYGELGNWVSSESWFQKSLEIKRRSGDVLGQASALSNLLRVYTTQGRLEEAVAAAQEAIHQFHAGGDLRGAAIAQQNLAKTYRKLGQTDLCRDGYRDAISLFTEANDSSGAAAAASELEILDEKTGLPWWAWGAIILFVLMLLILAAAVIITSME